MLLRITLPLFFVVGTLGLHAQKALPLEQFVKKYPEESAVFLKRSEVAEIYFEKGEPKVKSDIYEDLLILNEKGLAYNERSVYYSHFEKIEDLYPRTLVRKGSGYQTIKVKDFKRQSEFSSGVFYDDQRSISWNYPKMEPGARVVLSYTERLSEPRFFGKFFFASYLPAEEVEFIIKVPAGVKIRYLTFGKGIAEHTEVEVGNKTIHTWKASQVEKFKSGDGAPNIRYYVPHLVVFIESYKTKDGEVKLLSSPSDLYGWYYELTKNVNTNEAPELKKVVDSLVAGKTDEFEKVKTIYYWVQDNIKYVAFEDGLGGFVPRNASVVHSRRYGDCKDMSSLITRMLNMAGVESHLAWIGTRDIPYDYQQVPTPLADNHMIAAYRKDNTWYFLDATGKNAPIEIYTSMIQGKEALVGKGEGQFEIVKVPEIPKEMNRVCDSVVLRWKENKLQGKGWYIANGYEKISIGHRLSNMPEEDKLKFLKNYLQKGNNKFTTDSIRHKNLNHRSLPLEINYVFSLPDYCKINGEEMYLNLNLDKTFHNQVLEPEKRKMGYEFKNKTLDYHYTIFEIPEGYTLKHLPGDQAFYDPDFGFTIKYSQVGNRIICEKMIYRNILMLDTPLFLRWNEMVEAIGKAYGESVTFKKKSP